MVKFPEVRVKLKAGESEQALIKRVTTALGKFGHKDQITSFQNAISECSNCRITIQEWVTLLEPKSAESSNENTVLAHMLGLLEIFQWASIENRNKKFQVMSKSELVRIIDGGNLFINGEAVTVDEELDFPIMSIVFFPHSKAVKNTVW